MTCQLSKASTVERESQRRRFPPPWSVEEQPACFVVKDSAWLFKKTIRQELARDVMGDTFLLVIVSLWAFAKALNSARTFFKSEFNCVRSLGP